MAPSRKPPKISQQDLISYIASVLYDQLNQPSWYRSFSQSDLESLRKSSIKELYDNSRFEDTVTPLYLERASSDPIAQQMLDYFDMIESGGRSAEGIIEEMSETSDQGEDYFSVEQKEALRRFETESRSRKLAQINFENERLANAEIFGLPDPSEDFVIPRVLLEQLAPPKQKDGKTDAQVQQRALQSYRQRYEEEKKKLEEPVPGPTISETKTRTDPAAWLYNRTVGKVMGDEIQETRPANAGRTDIPRPEKANWDRNTAYVMMKAQERAAREAANFVNNLEQEVRTGMSSKYGSPYDVQMELILRMAEEEVLEKERKKREAEFAREERRRKKSGDLTRDEREAERIADLWAAGSSRNIYGKYAPPGYYD